MVISERGALSHEIGSTKIYENLSSNDLIAHALEQGIDGAQLLACGALAVDTHPDTGRYEDAKYFLYSEGTQDVNFQTVNKPISREGLDQLYNIVGEHLDRQPSVFVHDHSLGADPRHAIGVRTISENAWSTRFASILFRPPIINPGHDVPQYALLHAPSLKLKGEIPEILGDKAIVLDPENNLAVAVGTKYAGEIKKAFFEYLQYLYPRRGIATMHCSANMDEFGNVALFFGLSGTGKTTLSMDGERWLIGDDEHGWSDEGIFNFEGGSYAKVLGLNADDEPEIWKAVNSPGVVLENVKTDQFGMPIFSGKPENMRAAFPLSHFSKIVPSGMGGHPKDIFFLTADAMGVMPVVARLTPDQARYHYASGYTSKVAGTVAGLDGVKPDFSACYGKPFLAYPPQVYIEQFGERMESSGASVWLINTGWLGGRGHGGKRNLELTRAVVRGILEGRVSDGVTPDDLGFFVPKQIGDIPAEFLHSRNHFKDPADYDTAAPILESMFADNIVQLSGTLSADARNAGPHYIAA